MLPPEHACHRLAEAHPQLRLCWEGDNTDELNGGAFGICQLYHISDCGDIGDPSTFREFWEVSTVMDDGVQVRKRVDRGPLFSRRGDTQIDYDPAFRFPMYIVKLDGSLNFDGRPVDTQSVFDGSFIDAVRYWLSDADKRLKKNRKKRYDEFMHTQSELDYQLTSDTKRELNAGGAGGTNMAWKHSKADVYKMYNKKARLDETFNRMFKQ